MNIVTFTELLAMDYDQLEASTEPRADSASLVKIAREKFLAYVNSTPRKTKSDLIPHPITVKSTDFPQE